MGMHIYVMVAIFHMNDIYEMMAIFQFFHNGWCWYSISINTQKTGDPNFGGVGNLKFFHMIDIYEIVAIFQFFHNGQCWYSISINTWKTRDPNFSRVGNLKFFHMIDIYKMVAIFQFFHNGWLRYSTSINTWKTGDPYFGRVGNNKFFHMINIYKITAIFWFFQYGRCWYSVSVNTWKTRDPNFGASVIWNFSIWLIFTKSQPFFNFFIMADMLIFHFCWHSENQRPKLWGGSVIWNFLYDEYLQNGSHFLFFHNGWCWYSVSINTQKTTDPNFRGVSNLNFSVQSIFM